MGQQFYNQLGAGKLNGVNFERVPTNEAQGAGYGFLRLNPARAALEQAQAK